LILWEIKSSDNLEETLLAVRPNKIIALKPNGDTTKVLVENFPHWILVEKNFNDLLEELKKIGIRTKVRKMRKKEGNQGVD
jgi:hypothetical protein